MSATLPNRKAEESRTEIKQAQKISARPSWAFEPIDLAPFVNPDDFDDSVRLKSANILGDTFRRIGFAQIKGHGVPQDLVMLGSSAAHVVF